MQTGETDDRHTDRTRLSMISDRDDLLQQAQLTHARKEELREDEQEAAVLKPDELSARHPGGHRSPGVLNIYKAHSLTRSPHSQARRSDSQVNA